MREPAQVHHVGKVFHSTYLHLTCNLQTGNAHVSVLLNNLPNRVCASPGKNTKFSAICLHHSHMVVKSAVLGSLVPGLRVFHPGHHTEFGVSQSMNLLVK